MGVLKRPGTANSPMQRSEKDWQAESDAETLVRAKEIQADASRRAAAAKAAQRLLDEAKEKAKNMSCVARMAKKK